MADVVTVLRERFRRQCTNYVRRSDTCSLGIDPKTLPTMLRPTEFGTFKELPCTLATDPEARSCCAQCKAPTEAEIEAEAERITKNRVAKVEARKRIAAAAGDLVNVHGRVDCPQCGRVRGLQFAIAGNGHCTARCESGNCLSWME